MMMMKFEKGSPDQVDIFDVCAPKKRAIFHLIGLEFKQQQKSLFCKGPTEHLAVGQLCLQRLDLEAPQQNSSCLSGSHKQQVHRAIFYRALELLANDLG